MPGIGRRRPTGFPAMVKPRGEGASLEEGLARVFDRQCLGECDFDGGRR